MNPKPLNKGVGDVRAIVEREPARKGVGMKRVSVVVTVAGVFMLLACGVALAAQFEGTNGPDTIVGTNGPDDIRGRGGDDNLSGQGGIDRVRGDGGNDTVSGGPGGTLDRRERVEGNGGNDTVSGDGGADEVRGDLGDDDMLGGDGPDQIRADDDGADTVDAGAGNDVVEAHDDEGIDTIVCGDGTDSVRFDAGVDVVAPDCERQDAR
jgi:Ca2+-binding RTX toxin-like protein